MLGSKKNQCVTNSFMIVRLQRIETETAKEPLASQLAPTESLMIAEHAACHRPEQPDLVDRKLRNRLILANVVAWIAIFVAIRLIFF
jgi:hypothetical protein